ncbi:MAG: cytochrome c oxidase subunit 3 [Bernardetiaceae bacterium]|nr:cytochrome c oxidase subunit 3 [Bernardetiaceae bacterium]
MANESTVQTSSTTALNPNQTGSIWGGGESPMKAEYGKLMMWFFLLSDALTFSAFLIAYGVARYSYPAYEGAAADFVYNPDAYWPIPEKVYNAIPFFHGLDAPLIFVGLMTFILILSSVTMVLAVEAGNTDALDPDTKQAEVQKWMLWTIFGGIIFLSCQAWEWAHFIEGTEQFMTGITADTFFGANLTQNQYGPPLFAAFFFFITGFHGMHVLSGVVLNIILFYNTVMGTYRKRGHYLMVEKIGLYWHFVDLVWVFVFTFFYLV